MKPTSFHKTWLQDGLRVIVSLSFIFILCYMFRDKWTHSIEVLRRINGTIFLTVFGLFFFTCGVAAYRLKLVLEIQHISIPLAQVFYYCLVGLFFNLFLPSSLGGDVVKIYYLSKRSGANLKSISSVLTDRILGLSAVIIVALTGLPFFMKSFSDKDLVTIVIVFGVVFFIACITIFSRRVANRFKFFARFIPSENIKKKIGEFYQTILRFRHELPKLTGCVLLSLFIQGITIWMGYLVSKSLGMNVPFIIFVLILPITGVISMLPSLGGLGVREASLIYFLNDYSTPELSGAFVLAYDILVYGSGLFCGILFMFFDRKINFQQVKARD